LFCDVWRLIFTLAAVVM